MAVAVIRVITVMRAIMVIRGVRVIRAISVKMVLRVARPTRAYYGYKGYLLALGVPVTVPGLWVRGFLDICWGLLGSLWGVSWRQF